MPWEGRAPAEIDVARLEELPAREDWPRGATSDDTAQLLLLAGVLGGGGDAREFMERLSVELPSIRGSGPSTEAAVAEFRRSGRLEAVGGTTNGAAMRAPALGWAAREPRPLALRVSRTTHGGAGAVAAACAVAAMASAALEGGRGRRGRRA